MRIIYSLTPLCSTTGGVPLAWRARPNKIKAQKKVDFLENIEGVCLDEVPTPIAELEVDVYAGNFATSTLETHRYTASATKQV